MQAEGYYCSFWYVHYAADGGNHLPTFQYKPSVLFSRFKKYKKKSCTSTSKMGPIGCTETSVMNYHCTPNPEKSRFYRKKNTIYIKLPRIMCTSADGIV